MNVRAAFVTLATSLLMLGCQDASTVEESQLEQETSTDQTCFRGCQHGAEQGLRACLLAGRDGDSCVRRYQATVLGCEVGCSSAEPPANPPADPSCQQVCSDRAAQVSAQCLRSGGEARACEARAAQFASSCERGCGPAEPPANPPADPSCQQVCSDRAAEVAAQCVRSGGDARACEARAAQVASSCERDCR